MDLDLPFFPADAMRQLHTLRSSSTSPASACNKQ